MALSHRRGRCPTAIRTQQKTEPRRRQPQTEARMLARTRAAGRAPRAPEPLTSSSMRCTRSAASSRPIPQPPTMRSSAWGACCGTRSMRYRGDSARARVGLYARLSVVRAAAPRRLAARPRGTRSRSAGLRGPAARLQPLVENAVRHAIAPSPDGGTIQVTASVHDHALTLRVERRRARRRDTRHRAQPRARLARPQTAAGGTIWLRGQVSTSAQRQVRASR